MKKLTIREILEAVAILDAAPMPMENRKIYPPLSKRQKQEILKFPQKKKV